MRRRLLIGQYESAKPLFIALKTSTAVHQVPSSKENCEAGATSVAFLIIMEYRS